MHTEEWWFGLFRDFTTGLKSESNALSHDELVLIRNSRNKHPQSFRLILEVQATSGSS